MKNIHKVKFTTKEKNPGTGALVLDDLEVECPMSTTNLKKNLQLNH